MDKIYYQLYYSDYNDIYCLNYNNLDSKALKKILNDYTMLCNKYNAYGNETISIFLYDIEMAMKHCSLTDVQKRRLNLWFMGYNEKDIAELEGVSRWVISKSLHAACSKILSVLRCE